MSTDYSKHKKDPGLNVKFPKRIINLISLCKRVERKTRRVEKKASFENSAERVKNVFGITLQSFGGTPVSGL